MIGPEDQKLFERLVDPASRIVLTTHINPDGDALGSQVSLAQFLKSRGKSVRIVNHDAAPPILGFIEDPDHPVEIFDPAVHDAVLGDADLLILVDNSAPDRLGHLERLLVESADRTLCIDHHPSRGTPWVHHILDEGACATAVLIFELLRGSGWEPNPLAATALYVGLATDTGFFRFNSTNSEGHAVASELLRLGVDPARAYRRIHERNTEAYTRLLGQALVGLELAADGAIALVRITREMVDRLDAQEVDSSEIATSLLAIDGISVAFLFRELEDDRVKVSLRSKGDLDVHKLASEFGGGGHRNASGIVIDLPLDEIVRRVVERTTTQLG